MMIDEGDQEAAATMPPPTVLGRTFFLPHRWARRLRALWRPRPSRQLRLTETVTLGEHRFIAVIEFEQQRFLIGGSSNSVAMLARLSDRAPKETEKTPAREVTR